MDILIAEDQRVVRMAQGAVMAGWGFRCEMAENGAEAVELARRNGGRYDLCIMDVSMPVMDGIEATREIRNSVGYFPILGHSSEISARARCLEAGMDDFLLNPFCVGYETIF